MAGGGVAVRHRPSLDPIGHASGHDQRVGRRRGGGAGRAPAGRGRTGARRPHDRRGAARVPRRRPPVLGRHRRHGHRRLPQAPVPRRAQVPRLGIPGFAFSDGPRGVVVGNATCFPVTMARGATWDLDLEERIGEAIGARAAGGRRRPLRRRVRQRAPPPGVGPSAGDLRRGPAPRRRDGRRPHPGRAAPRHGHASKHFACNSMENARFKVDVDGRRAWRSTRCTSRTSSGSSTRAWPP